MSDFIKEKLHNKHLKVTPARVQLISLLDHKNSAVPFSEIQEDLCDYDRVTIYRSLNTLEEKGIIHKVQSEHNEMYYAICEESCSTHDHHHDHIHFNCKVCNTIRCVPYSQNLNINLPGYEIDELKIMVEGTCKNCSK